MLAELIADAVVLLHFFWILFLVFGFFLGRRYRWVRIFHMAGIVFALCIQAAGWYCPLTYLEVWLRRLQGSSHGYTGSFIIYYIEKFVYVELPGRVIFAGTVLLAVITVLLYLVRPARK